MPASSADRTIGLKDAVREIELACRGEGHRNFVFVVGAGISNPPVPLSSEITGFCREEALKTDLTIPEGADKSPMWQYSYWFQKAFPQPSQQQQYLESLIKNKPLSLASLRLAHILMSGKVANVAVTPNFDDFVARALRLFGDADFRLCDHPRMVDRIDLEAKTIQIVHVHGTYQFYDMANLGGEIKRRAELSEETTLTISDPVSRIFENRFPLIIGYSGWQGDVIMSALKRRLQDRRLGCNLYFFCYRRSAIDGLPRWLTSHQDVRFVAPAEAESRLPTNTQTPANQTVPEDGCYSEQPMSYSVSLHRPAGDTEPTLRAQEVLDELIRALSLEVPKLFNAPLDLLEQQILVATLPGNESDLYGFGSVLRDIRSARACLATQKTYENEVDRHLESVRDAIRRSQYDQAISAASSIDLFHLSAERKEELFLALKLVNAAAERKEDTISSAELMERIYDSLDVPQAEELQVSLCWALAQEGHATNQMGRFQDALAVFDRIVQRFGDHTEVALRKLLAWALLNKGLTLGKLERPNDEVAVYDDMLRLFGDSSDLTICIWIATALRFKGITLCQLNRAQDAVAIFDELIRRFASSTETEVLQVVSQAFINKGATLGKLDRPQDEVAAYDDMLRRLGDSSDPEICERVARALWFKGTTLRQLNGNEDAVATFDELIRRFADSTEIAILRVVAQGFINKGLTLAKLERPNDEVAVYDDMLRRLGDSSDPTIRERVATALRFKGLTLAQLGNRDKALDAYNEVQRRFSDATDPALQKTVSLAMEERDELSNRPAE